jgi:predicted RNA-binding Zn ribbon-like protein
MVACSVVVITAVCSFVSDDGRHDLVTGQEAFDSDEHAGVVTAVGLVNALASYHAFGRPFTLDDPVDPVRTLLAADPTWPAVRRRDVPGLCSLAASLRTVFEAVHRDDVDAAAGRLNRLLRTHPAHPHLAKDDGTWRLHHHPAEATLVAMATAICAEAMARVIGSGAARRLGTCDADNCDRVFFDGSKNASRRFCSTPCQNRMKAAAFRRRRTSNESPR